MDLENRLVGKCKQFDAATQLNIIPEFYLASKLISSRGQGQSVAMAELKKLYKPHLVSSFDNINLISVRSDAPQLEMDLEDIDDVDLPMLCAQKVPLFVRYICDELVNYLLYSKATNLGQGRPRGKTERIPKFREYYEGADSNPLALLSKSFWLNFDLTERQSDHASLASVINFLLFKSKKWSKTHASKQARAFMARFQLIPTSITWSTALSNYINTLEQPTAFLTLHEEKVFRLGFFWAF